MIAAVALVAANADAYDDDESCPNLALTCIHLALTLVRGAYDDDRHCIDPNVSADVRLGLKRTPG